MQINEFFDALGKLSHDGKIKPIYGPRGQIRLQMEGMTFDPITVLAYVQSGEFIEARYWVHAALTLELPLTLADQITAAVDNHFDGKVELRERIQMAVGL